MYSIPGRDSSDFLMWERDNVSTRTKKNIKSRENISETIRWYNRFKTTPVQHTIWIEHNHLWQLVSLPAKGTNTSAGTSCTLLQTLSPSKSEGNP